MVEDSQGGELDVEEVVAVVQNQAEVVVVEAVAGLLCSFETLWRRSLLGLVAGLFVELLGAAAPPMLAAPCKLVAP